MKVKRIDIIRREDGFFHPDGKQPIKAYKHGNGYGAAVFFEISPVDGDFNEFVWFYSAEELRRMAALMDKSDELTFKMLGHGWEGTRPFHKLEEFV